MSDDRLRCSFCTKSQETVAKLIAGTDVYICDADIARAEQGLRSASPHETCSFCGKTELDAIYTPPATWMFSPPDLAICRDCVKWCREVIDEDVEIAEAMRVELKTPATAIAVEGARCPSCRAVLAESARSQFVDVPGDGDATAQVLFLYCSNCGHTLDDVILPSE